MLGEMDGINLIRAGYHSLVDLLILSGRAATRFIARSGKQRVRIRTILHPAICLLFFGALAQAQSISPWTRFLQENAPTKKHRVNGACGPANGVATHTEPTSGLCMSGVASAETGTGPWDWSC